jgi:hypothetical protein
MEHFIVIADIIFSVICNGMFTRRCCLEMKKIENKTAFSSRKLLWVAVVFVIALVIGFFLFNSHKNPSSRTSFTSQSYQVKLSYPSLWKALPFEEPQIEPFSFEGRTGFFSLSAKKNEEGLSLLEICKNEVASPLSDFGSAPKIQKFFLNAREAYYVIPSKDQSEEEKGKACMITFYPLPVWIDFDFHDVFILSASKDQIFQITESLEFLYK